jgi:hypothetical protein
MWKPPDFAWSDPVAVCIDVVTVPDPETVRYRAHLDLDTTSSAHHAELVAYLLHLVATPAGVGQGDTDGNSVGQDHVPHRLFWPVGPSWVPPHGGSEYQDDQSAKMDRLRALGAIDVDLGQGDVPWVCLADPEGNDFCVLTPG